jgi:hypothetical protein
MDWLNQIRERRAERRAHELNLAIRALPLRTRQAMLKAAASDELIAGAYVDSRGRKCPMLAAHHRGAPTHARGFPCAWDRFTGAKRPRAATQRELEVLIALLQESIAEGLAPPPRDGRAAPPGRVLSEL